MRVCLKIRSIVAAVPVLVVYSAFVLTLMDVLGMVCPGMAEWTGKSGSGVVYFVFELSNTLFHLGLETVILFGDFWRCAHFLKIRIK